MAGCIRVKIVVLLLFCFGITQSQIMISEFLASNTQTNYHPTYTEFSDWIEVHNTSSQTVNLFGYYLTDDLSVPTKWRININVYLLPGEYWICWANGRGFGNNTNFKLSSDVEELGLAKMNGELIDAIHYPPQYADISYGRSTNNPDEWGYYYKPTPNAANHFDLLPELIFAGCPVFSVPGGVYSDPIEIVLSSLNSDEIRYTLDGTFPSENSELYNSPIQTSDTTTIIRARSFRSGYAPSKVISNTYICNQSHDLPIVCLTTDPCNLWNDTIGIYCVGTNGIGGFGGTIANYWHTDWERPVNVEIIEIDGEQVINQIAGFAINGARRNMGQKSLRLFARNKYGSPHFNHQLFSDRDNTYFSSLVLRNGGLPDFSHSMIRDGLSQTLISDNMTIDYQSYRQAVLYINGAYWGIYNIREKQNEDYLEANRGIDPNNINMLEGPYGSVIEGSNEDYHLLQDFMANNNLNDPDNYAFLEGKIDIDNYIDYQTAEIYMGNYDWPGLNIKFWNENKHSGKWKWMLFDLDAGFGLWSTYGYSMIHHATRTDGPNWPNPPGSTLFFRNMLTAQTFKNRFVQRYAAHVNTTFTPERIVSLMDSLKTNIESEMPSHIARWKDCGSSDGTCVQSMAEWEEEFNTIYDFAVLRPQFTQENFMDELNLSGIFNLFTLAFNGHIEINDVPLPSGLFQGSYFKNIPFHAKAVPDLGYKFVGWVGPSGSLSTEIELNLDEDTYLTALFDIIDHTILPANFSSDDTLYTALSPYMGMGDVNIESNVTVYVQPGVKILMPEACCINVYGQLNIDGTQEMPVSINPNLEVGTQKWGALCYYNTTDSCFINYLEILDASIGRIDTLQIGALSSYNSKLSISNTSIEKSGQPFYSELGEIKIDHCTFRSDVTCDLINIKYADFALVENCYLKGNEAPDTDAIDYDQISHGIIRNNVIHSFFGFNSDGIDVGEQAQNILIENNRIFNCSDKGISIGQASTAIIKRNTIYNCNLGIGIKDSLAFAEIDQNTFFNNNYAVACFEKNYNGGGGSAEVKNSILANSKVSTYLLDDKSLLEITYSLSNTDSLIGVGNLFLDPMFADSVLMNFELLADSPCIDSGDPSSPNDPDGSNADMGAYFVFQPPSIIFDIVINEINYNSDSLNDSGDWIELYNNGQKTVDLSGWVFMDSKDDNRYYIPNGLTLGIDQYLVMCNDKNKFCSINSGVTNYIGNIPFSLNNSGEMIRLFDSEMNLVDLVEYNDQDPWPEEADGEGPTLQLIDPDYDNNIASSWEASAAIGGTPGEYHLVWTKEIIAGEVLIYPNPASGIFYIQKDKEEDKEIIMEIYNVNGQRIKTLKDNSRDSKFRIDCSSWQQGLYLIRIIQDNEILNGKIIVQ
jgi:parallel beta-helix repeat protein